MLETYLQRPPYILAKDRRVISFDKWNAEMEYRAGEGIKLLAQMVSYPRSNGHQTPRIDHAVAELFYKAVIDIENSRRGRRLLDRLPKEERARALIDLDRALTEVSKHAGYTKSLSELFEEAKQVLESLRR